MNQRKMFDDELQEMTDQHVRTSEKMKKMHQEEKNKLEQQLHQYREAGGKESVGGKTQNDGNVKSKMIGLQLVTAGPPAPPCPAPPLHSQWPGLSIYLYIYISIYLSICLVVQLLRGVVGEDC